MFGNVPYSPGIDGRCHGKVKNFARILPASTALAPLLNPGGSFNNSTHADTLIARYSMTSTLTPKHYEHSPSSDSDQQTTLVPPSGLYDWDDHKINDPSKSEFWALITISCMTILVLAIIIMFSISLLRWLDHGFTILIQYLNTWRQGAMHRQDRRVSRLHAQKYSCSRR